MKKLKSILLTAALICICAMAVNAQKGNLIYVETEHVDPANRAEYVDWAKAYKELADKTAAPNFYVASNNKGYSYIHNIGTDYKSLDEFLAKRSAWYKANPEAGDLNDKYGHTVSYASRYLWRHSPKYSYAPENSDAVEMETPYTRFFAGYISTGKGSEVGKLLDEYKASWKEAGLENPYNVYWNVFGEESTCMLVVQSFKDRAAWVAYEAQVEAKISKEKLAEWQVKWSELLRRYEDREGQGHLDLSHSSDE